MSLKVVEFFNYNDELWYRLADGTVSRFTESSVEIIKLLSRTIEDFYPKAYEALSREYEACKGNMHFYMYRIVLRFCRCNFGNIDSINDIDALGRLNLECVPCPLRGECPLEGVVCNPEFDSQLRPSELRVLELWYDGKSKDEIANRLYLSLNTVNNHIRNAYSRLGIREKAEFFRYAEKHKLFKQ